MINYFLNKNAVIKVAFANYSSPLSLVGKITEMDEQFSLITFDPQHKQNKLLFKDSKGQMLVRNNYIIAISLLNE